MFLSVFQHKLKLSAQQRKRKRTSVKFFHAKLHSKQTMKVQTRKVIINRYNSVGFWKSGMRSTIILKLLF